MLFKSTAILNYLEATRPLTALAPTDARDRALVDMHTKLCDLQFTCASGDRCVRVVERREHVDRVRNSRTSWSAGSGVLLTYRPRRYRCVSLRLRRQSLPCDDASSRQLKQRAEQADSVADPASENEQVPPPTSSSRLWPLKS